MYHAQPETHGWPAALEQHGLTADNAARPAYQQNDYRGCIERAKRPATPQKQLTQMLDELRRGGVYMRMDHPPSRRD